jgi:hypothetical protein
MIMGSVGNIGTRDTRVKTRVYHGLNLNAFHSLFVRVSVMKEAELCALAKKQIGLLDKSPVGCLYISCFAHITYKTRNQQDSTVPKSYLDELKTHAGLYPHDTNVRR